MGEWEMIWKEKYRIGVSMIDKQHQELFRRVEDFIVNLRSSGKWEDRQEKVKSTMEFMKEYVVVHFRAEEEYQKKINYPGLAEHQRIHAGFKEEINNFAQKFEEEGYQEDLVQSLAGKLLAWLINHVASEDQKIGSYTKSLGGDSNEG